MDTRTRINFYEANSNKYIFAYVIVNGIIPKVNEIVKFKTKTYIVQAVVHKYEPDHYFDIYLSEVIHELNIVK